MTPAQSVSAADQTIEVGVTGPSVHVSGPGEVDLFGQQLTTSVNFAGPIRPRVRLARITLSQQLHDFTDTSAGRDPQQSIAAALVRGFRHYLYWQIIIVGLLAVLLAGAVSGWMRRGWRYSLALIGVVLLVTEP